MLALLRKEIRSFLTSLIGYIVIAVFLIVTSLFMWVFPGAMNVMDAEYATLDTLFYIAPWVFLFLIPAITMRSLAEEQKEGTLELLMTKPITDLQIILAKYLAGLLVVVIAIFPTLVYFLSVYLLGSPVGNIDTGGMWGSYFGLLFLASAFVAIGIFSSSVSENQIVAFTIGVFLSFFCFIGFESISSLDLLGKIDSFIIQLGINEHYVSMSRGVIDTRDVIYFFSINALFIIITKTILESRKW